MKRNVLLVLLSILAVISFGFTLYLPIVFNAGQFTPTPHPPGVYTFTDGYGGNVDTGMDVNLHRKAHDLNGGQHDAIQFGDYNYALIKFDLSSLPGNAIIQKATLYLGTTGKGSANIYAVAPANAGWIEGIGNLQLAKKGEPCWDARAADGNGGILIPWAGGKNGAGVVGTDIGENPIGVFSANQAVKNFAVPLTVVALQDWVGANNVNAGILIKPTIFTSYHIALSEYADPTLRPKLVVEYLVPSSVNTAQNGTLENTIPLPSMEINRWPLAKME